MAHTEEQSTMRFLLVGPEREENLSIRYLSAALRGAGHEAEIAPFDRPGDIAQVLLRAPGFEAIGLSLCSQVRAREFLTLAAALKLQAPGVPVIAGGHYATCAADDLLAHHHELDVIVVHEGERTIVDLANAGVSQSRLGGIPGLVFRDKGKIVRTPPRPIETDLNALPHPDRRGRVRMLAGVPTAYVMGSRGCFANCDYCCIVTLHRLAPGPRFRQRTPENIADEMESLYHERGIRQFVFHDDNFLVRSVEHNHQRLDALEAAWKKRGLRRIGIVIKCRPGEVNESVFCRLKELGLVRVFLGVESASSQGLAAIGRDQSVRESAEALALCRRLGISVQYTLMCFHPDATPATVRADLAFFRENMAHPINFCRTEIYAGTPLEARMRAEGRARGDYLARTYTIANGVVSDTCKLTGRIFHPRCWATDSLMETAIGLDHLAAVLRHFRPGVETADLSARITDWRNRTNLDTIGLLDELLTICEAHPGLENPSLHRAARDLVRREGVSRCELLREGFALRAEASRVGRAGRASRSAQSAAACQCAVASSPVVEGDANNPASSDLRTAIMRAAAAATIAIAVAGCSGKSSDAAVSEMAPTPMQIDTDEDGLPDICETTVFDTDPEEVDSDADGIDDGDEDHDGGGMTNRDEVIANDSEGDTCTDVVDTPVSEYAPPMMQDSDGDGLPDICETSVFDTDPADADSDADGTEDGEENHDGGMMTNLEEAEANDQWGSVCTEIVDTPVNEAAPQPMQIDTDGDGLPDICETGVFGTDPELVDTDGDGTEDGDENHDGGTMSNRDEALANDPLGDTCSNIYDSAVSEAAPPMMRDSDGDGLPDICETDVFGTDSNATDTDGDGTEDGDENHDGGTMTNLEEAQANDRWGSVCTDIVDTPVNEAAPKPMQIDTDDDGLPDICETGVFGTDPELADTDGDGAEDGDENHDGGTMTNLEEAQANDQSGTVCTDIVDTPVNEAAPKPMQIDTDDDGLPDICETGVFGTDPELADTDGDGTEDGDEDHDGGTMTNLEEVAMNDPLGETCSDIFDSAVSEAAPPMMEDSDGDGLPDICEEGVFGTDPYATDSDEDGTADGAENHDGGTMTNLEEAQANGRYGWHCSDIEDAAVDEAAPPPMQVDTDGDGLPDICEINVFFTDPTLADSDEDGTADGAEEHDFGTMTNLEEAQANDPNGDTCSDVYDPGTAESAPPMMQDRDGDGLPNICETAVFGTNPSLADTDGDGTEDGDENHDGGTMTNLEEAQANNQAATVCVDIDDTQS